MMRVSRWLGLLSVVIMVMPRSAADPPATPPNLLFIYVDDLNMDIERPGLVLPGFDALAARGVRFTRAYASHPLCGPSRASLLAGQRTVHTETASNYSKPPEEGINGVPYLPRLLRNNGYYSVAMGKIFAHVGLGKTCWDESYDFQDDPWIQKPTPAAPYPSIHGGPYLNGPDDSAGKMRDTKSTNRAIHALIQAKDRIAHTGQPFSLWVGFRTTHEPYVYPERFHGLYTDGDVPALPAEEATGAWKQDVDPVAYTTPNYYDAIMGVTEEQRRLETRKAYLRCISFVDEQILRLLNALDGLGLAGTTTIVLVSDHGLSFGEHGHVGKSTGYEQDIRSPLFIASPALEGSHGKQCDRPVEHVDLYATLAELFALPTFPQLDGKSLVALLQEPTLESGPAFITADLYSGFNLARYVVSVDPETGHVWKLGAWEKAKAFSQVNQLYDLTADPGEYHNLYTNPQWSGKVTALEDLLFGADMLGADARHYGGGLAGTLGVPQVDLSPDPKLGVAATLTVSNSAGAATAVVITMGFEGRHEFVFGGVQLNDAAVAISAIAPASGLSASVTIPSHPSLDEVPISVQAFEMDAGAPQGVSISRGLALLLGQ